MKYAITLLLIGLATLANANCRELTESELKQIIIGRWDIPIKQMFSEEELQEVRGKHVKAVLDVDSNHYTSVYITIDGEHTDMASGPMFNADGSFNNDLFGADEDDDSDDELLCGSNNLLRFQATNQGRRFTYDVKRLP